ncbi:MAG: LamG domain-containing protein [bacterium]|nr:LamG domain-containing protein [bacterium]
MIKTDSTHYKMLMGILFTGIILAVFSSIGRCQSLDKDIIGWWAFDEGQGSIIADKSPYGNNGKVLDGTWTKGCFGQTIKFEGDMGVRVESSESLNSLTDAMSLEVWFSPSATIGRDLQGFQHLVNRFANNSGYAFNFREKTGRLALLAGDSRTYSCVTSKTNLWEGGKWYYAVFTWDGKSGKVYINGQLEVESGLARIANWSGAMFIGRKFYGSIGDVKLWRRALMPEEITKNYNDNKKLLAGGTAMESKSGKSSDGSCSYANVKFSDVDFGISKSSGAIRYYRVNGKDPLIEYISLNEGDKSQVRSGGKWTYDWSDGSLSILQGIKQEDPIIGTPGKTSIPLALPLTTLQPQDGAIKLAASGKLDSLWRKDVEINQGKTENITRISYERLTSKGTSGKPVSVSFKLMRWLEDEDTPIYIENKDGRRQKLIGGSSVEDGNVLIPFWKQGRMLMLSIEPCARIDLSRVQPLTGGRILTFLPGTADRFTLTIRDINNSDMLKAGCFALRVNQHNAAVHLELGNTPLFSIEGFEGKYYQSYTGYENDTWLLQATPDNNGFKVSGKGKLFSPWAAQIRGESSRVEFGWENLGKSDEPGGVHISVPYKLVGSRMEIIYPDGKSINRMGKIPLRLGMEQHLGTLRSGTKLVFYPTSTEKITLSLRGDFSASSYRKSIKVYHEPFDLSYEPVFYRDVDQKGVIYSFPPAGLLLVTQNTGPFGITASYERAFSTAKAAVEKSASYKELPASGIKIVETRGGFEVCSPFWKVQHEKISGGGITGISFPYASGKNILVAPENIYIQINGVTYSNTEEKKPLIEAGKEHIRVKGLLKSDKGESSGVGYEAVYTYKPWCIEREVFFHFTDEKTVEKVGVLKLDFDSLLDRCGYKPVVAIFKRAVFPGAPITEGKTLGYGFISLFAQGGEGIDFVPGDDTYGWRYQISANNNDGYWAVIGNEAGGPSLLVEPYCRKDKPVAVKGTKHYSHYLGLPMTGKYLPPQHFPVMSTYKWLNEKAFKELADNGVDIIHHGGYSKSAVGGVPPQPEEVPSKDREYFQTTKQWPVWGDKYGLKIVPFYAKGLLSSTVPAYKEHVEEWARMRQSKQLPVKPDPYGDYMCHSAKGFNDYWQQTVLNWNHLFGWQGVYYDFVYPSGPCWNPRHAAHEHLDVSGVLEFMEWTRKKFDLVWAHTGYYPTIMLENLADMLWVGEELNFWYSNDGRVSDLDQMAESFLHTLHTQRAIDIHTVFSWQVLPQEGFKADAGAFPRKMRIRCKSEDVDAFICRLSLNGLFPIIRTEDIGAFNLEDKMARLHPWLKLFRSFKGIDFSRLHFDDWKKQGAIVTDNPSIRAAVYWNDTEALLVLANSESALPQRTTFKVNTEALGWEGKTPLNLLERLSGKKLSVNGSLLRNQGVVLELPGYGYKVYQLKLETGRK